MICDHRDALNLVFFFLSHRSTVFG